MDKKDPFTKIESTPLSQNGSENRTDATGAPVLENTKKKARNSGAKVINIYGKRFEKNYPITEDELGELFGIGLLATVSFSIFAGLLGFAVDIFKDIYLNDSIPTLAVKIWGYIAYTSIILCIVFFVIGIFTILRGRNKIKKIKDKTHFNE